MSDVFTLAGSAITVSATDYMPVKFSERFGSIPFLTLQLRGVQPPPEASDPAMGQTLTWANGGTTYFSGYIRSRTLREPTETTPWIIEYQALGLRDLLDKFPLTDKTTGLDVSPFNMQPEDLANYNLARAGRTVGQILTDVLTSLTNGANMVRYGLGNLTGPSGDVYVLPSATIADLAALSVIPPRPVYVTGEKLGGAIDGFLQANAPNVRLWVQPDGTLRFLDLTTFSANTLTMGSDPIDPTEMSRDVSDCWQRLQIRGAPIAVMSLFKLSQGTLLEDFTWGTFSTNAAAKAAWSPTDFTGTASVQDTGTCTMGSTTTVTVTSSNTSATWVSDFWDQSSTGTHGTVNLYNSATTGVTTFWTSPIVANTALTAGGTSTLTIAVAAPNTAYDHYTISGYTNGASLVYRQYQIADTTLWPLMVAQSTYPQPFINPGGGATLTSTPIGSVLWSQGTGSHTPPYNMFPLPFQMFPSTGTIVFTSPTYIVANNQDPDDVWAMIPINTGPNLVSSPQDVSGAPQYSGDSNTIEGLEDTLVVTMADWRDPGQISQVQAFADDWLKSVHNGVREGAVRYYGLYTPALTFGLGLSIAGLKDDGTTDTTGWESANIPIVEVEVDFTDGALDYVTTIHVSSRRAHYSAEMFMRPAHTFLPIGLAEGSQAVQIGGTVGNQYAYEAANTANNTEALTATSAATADSLPEYLKGAGVPSAQDHVGNPTRPAQQPDRSGDPIGDDGEQGEAVEA